MIARLVRFWAVRRAGSLVWHLLSLVFVSLSSAWIASYVGLRWMDQPRLTAATLVAAVAFAGLLRVTEGVLLRSAVSRGRLIGRSIKVGVGFLVSVLLYSTLAVTMVVRYSPSHSDGAISVVVAGRGNDGKSPGADLPDCGSRQDFKEEFKTNGPAGVASHLPKDFTRYVETCFPASDLAKYLLILSFATCVLSLALLGGHLRVLWTFRPVGTADGALNLHVELRSSGPGAYRIVARGMRRRAILRGVSLDAVRRSARRLRADLSGAGQSVAAVADTSERPVGEGEEGSAPLELPEAPPPRKGREERAIERHEAARRLGRELFAEVFRDEVLSLLHVVLEEAQRRDCEARLALSFDGTSELESLPWEYLFTPSLGFLTRMRRLSIVRHSEGSRAPGPLEVDGRLRVLVVGPNPQGVDPLRTEEERSNIERALAGAPGIVVENFRRESFTAFQERLRSGEPIHIIHYTGHGGESTELGEQEGCLYFQRSEEDPRALAVPALDVAEAVRDHDSVRLVVLNSCSGTTGRGGRPSLGVAPTLMARGTPSVVAMQAPIPDAAGLKFSQAFYRALGERQSLDEAVRRGRMAFSNAEPEWGLPVLFVHASNSRMFQER